MSNVKINGINAFVNKLDTVEDIIDIDRLKENFELDEGETGFYKLSLSQKKVFGTETVDDNYNRPPIGPIKNGLYCSYCGSVGPADHTEVCSRPEDDSLYLTIGGFNDYIIENIDYQGDYKEIRDSIKGGTVTQEQINEILLVPNEIDVSNGTLDISSNKSVLTNVSYFGIYKKKGPKKLSAKTTTTQFLNNVIISHEMDDIKTSIRVSKNGLINLINVPNEISEREKITQTLISRINKSGAVNVENFKSVTGLDEYAIVPSKSYIHSMSGQFTINVLEKPGNEVDFENLDKLISPYDSQGNLVSGDFTNVTDVNGNKVINFDGNKIIEWEYSIGRLTRNQIMTKEYIKFVAIPAKGVKLTAVINKFGIVMMTLSLCGEKQIKQGLCEPGNEEISKDMFDGIMNSLNKLFDKEQNILIKKSLSGSKKETTEYNTVSGYAPSGKICRLTRTRDKGDNKTYKEGMRPAPYSWSGTCPDPNYQYLKPEGVQDKDGLWYPCCETKTKESVERMKQYLITGFPRDAAEAKKYGIVNGQDLGSGIIAPDSNVIGASANVSIDGKYEQVTVIKKLSKKSNEYIVKRADGSNVTVKGTDFERDSRTFPGLNSFRREQLLGCIQKNLAKFDLAIIDGKLMKKEESDMNEKYNNERTAYLLSLLDPSSINTNNFNYSNVSEFTKTVYNVRKVPQDSYDFFLVLSPEGNFYINNKLKSIDCQISDKFSDTVVMYGYLRFNETEFKNEYHIVDLIYYNEQLNKNSFEQRYSILLDLQNLVFTSIVEEILIYPDVYQNVIEGSYEIVETDKNAKLVYVDTKCCEYVVWGNKDFYQDIIQLQILKKSGQQITFGYEDKSVPKGIGLDFLDDYTFNKREIPNVLSTGDYFNVKINRDASGNVVPNRKLGILEKSAKYKSYNETIDILLTKFNPVDITFFNDPDEWFTPDDKIYVFSGGLLKLV